MGQLSWGETTALWNPERAGGLREQHWASQKAFLECCHHPLAGWQNSTGSSEHSRRAGNRSLFLPRAVTGQPHHCSPHCPSLLEVRLANLGSHCGQIQVFFSICLNLHSFCHNSHKHFKWSGNETIKIIKMKIKNLCYRSGLKFSGLLSAYDSHTWGLWLVQTEGGIFTSTVDVTWILPKANSFQLTNNHCPANISSWVIILPLYQEAAWVKKPWGTLGLQTHVISLEMKATTKCFTNLYLFSCW